MAYFALAATPAQRVLAGDAGAPVAVAARLSQDQGGAKLVFDLSRTVAASASALASPDRIVVDMPEVNFQLDSSVGRVGALRDDSLIKGFRFGLLAAGKSRIVVDLARAACPADVSTRPIVDGAPAARLTIELMLAEIMQKTRMQLYLEFDQPVSDPVMDRLRPLVKRRADGEPLETWEDWSEATFLAEAGSVEPPSRPLSTAVLSEARDVLSDAEDGCHLHLQEDEE